MELPCFQKHHILFLDTTKRWPTRKYETSTVTLLPISFSPATILLLLVLFLCKDYGSYNSFFSHHFPCYLTLLWYLHGFEAHHCFFLSHQHFWVFYSDSTLDQAELMLSRRAHACMLHFLSSCIFENVCLLCLHLNDMLMGCCNLGTLFLSFGTL